MKLKHMHCVGVEETPLSGQSKAGLSLRTPALSWLQSISRGHTTGHGPAQIHTSHTRLRSQSVMRQAISMMVSLSGSKPAGDTTIT